MLISMAKFIQRVPITYGGCFFKNTMISNEMLKNGKKISLSGYFLNDRHSTITFWDGRIK